MPNIKTSHQAKMAAKIKKFQIYKLLVLVSYRLKKMNRGPVHIHDFSKSSPKFIKKK